MHLLSVGKDIIRRILRYIPSTIFAYLALSVGSLSSAETLKNLAAVQIVRNSSALCEPTCPEWISINGAIDPALPAKFKRLLKAVGDRKLPVVIASNGGDSDAAMKIGRLIRENRMDTAVGWTTIEKCKGGSAICRSKGFEVGRVEFGSAQCLSACVLILSGGVHRLSNRKSLVGIHRGKAMQYDARKHDLQEINNHRLKDKMISRYRKLISSYLTEMDVDPALEIESAKHAEIYEVAIEQQMAWKLITSSEIYPVVANVDVCKEQTLPTNCVTR